MAGSLLIVDEMYREGMALKRQQFQRAHPDASAEAIDAMLREWLFDRPMDAPGRVRKL